MLPQVEPTGQRGCTATKSGNKAVSGAISEAFTRWLHYQYAFVELPTMEYFTLSQKNDNDVLRYNFNAHQPILIIFNRDIAEWICY